MPISTRVVGIDRGCRSIILSFSMDSFQQDIVSACKPCPMSHGGFQLACISDDDLVKTDLVTF